MSAAVERERFEALSGGRDALIAAALAHATYPKPGAADFDQRALKVAVSLAEFNTVKAVQDEAAPVLAEAYEGFLLFNGDRPMYEAAAGDWDSALDDVVEAALAPWVPFLSQDWLGKNTVDTRLHEDGAVAKLAYSMGREAWKHFTFKKKPGQIASALGIVSTDFSTSTHPPQEVNNMTALREAVTALFGVVGAEFDPIELSEELDFMSDDDDILALAAIQRVMPGVDADFEAPAYIAGFREARAAHGKDAPGALLSLLHRLASGETLTCADPGGIAAPAPHAAQAPAQADDATSRYGDLAAPPGAPPPPAKRTRKGKAASEGALDARVLALLKAHGNVNDREMADALGVSRATFNNYANDKAALVPTEAQEAFIRSTLDAHRAGLELALSILDGLA